MGTSKPVENLYEFIRAYLSQNDNLSGNKISNMLWKMKVLQSLLYFQY